MKSNLFLKATLTDRCTNAEDTVRILCDYEIPPEQPAPSDSEFVLDTSNNFSFILDNTNIIRYIPNSSIVTNANPLTLQITPTTTLQVVSVTFPDVGSAPSISSFSAKTLVFSGVNIGQLSVNVNAVAVGSTLNFIVIDADGTKNISVTIPTSPLIQLN